MTPDRPGPRRTSDELAEWLTTRDVDHTLGALVSLFGERAFAVLYIVLLAVPALPAPTGGVTHVFELACVLLAAELLVGRDHVWLPARLQRREIVAGARSTRALLGVLRRLERASRPTWTFLFDHRLSNIVFGALELVAAVAAFLAPPFSGLDTVPALGGVVLSCGVLVKDARLAIAGIVLIAAGAFVVLLAGAAALSELRSLL